MYLHEVGPGGCRGDGWSDGETWPKFHGRVTFNKCALLCAQDQECTAIHILRPGGGLVECLHFTHDHPVNVPRLGGFCYEMDDDMQESRKEAATIQVSLVGEKFKRNLLVKK